MITLNKIFFTLRGSYSLIVPQIVHIFPLYRIPPNAMTTSSHDNTIPLF